MKFNIKFDDATGQQLNQAAQQTGESANTLVRQAVCEWLKRHNNPQWPDEVLSFKGIADTPPFEASRGNFQQPAADPLA